MRLQDALNSAMSGVSREYGARETQAGHVPDAM